MSKSFNIIDLFINKKLKTCKRSNSSISEVTFSRRHLKVCYRPWVKPKSEMTSLVMIQLQTFSNKQLPKLSTSKLPFSSQVHQWEVLLLLSDGANLVNKLSYGGILMQLTDNPPTWLCLQESLQSNFFHKMDFSILNKLKKILERRTTKWHIQIQHYCLPRTLPSQELCIL